MLDEFLEEYHFDDLQKILNNSEDCIHYSIHVNFLDLIKENPDVGRKVLHNPRHYLPLCNASIVSVQKKLVSGKQTVKSRVHLRIIGVPVKEHSETIGELVSICGIVVRMSQPVVTKLSKQYNCRKCKHTSVVNMLWERNVVPLLKECKACKSSNIDQVSSLRQESCSDHQEIKVQDKSQPDSNSSSVTGWQVVLLDDLVDKCKPGDQVEINGVFVKRWITSITEKTVGSTFMLANSVSVHRKVSELTSSTKEMKEAFSHFWEAHAENPLVGRDIILASICPQIYGMYVLKLSLAVVLAGGVTKTNATGINIRGESHLLMVGDPGTGKSQILRTATRLVVPSIRTTGIGSTSAGLTAAAVKDSDGWHLEAGALVLADGGICCIDEFTTMSAHDRACVHEAMEQQTISIAKAGIVSTLNSRCSVIAAINPEGGHFKGDEEYKTRLGNPLISRFDLILLLKDSRSLSWDSMSTKHILKAYGRSPDDASRRNSNEGAESNIWKEDDIREYLAHIHSLKPLMTEEAEKVLQAVFVHYRYDPKRETERKTVRMMESLVRLAEGHARLMYRSEVILMDAIIAAQLVGSASGLGKEVGSPFPDDPMANYYEEGLELLHNIGLGELRSFL
ncbi:DNA helicase MCM9-like [Leptopilina heterotoma]|uniref:DNA helicase MCM9-like n=1 Tax=Leptopilina heterotoma TaxID=63436 RepID=UPI001CA9BD95|nr:DNA helicase MCM9-like [Leptopilina heterotoma]